MELRLKRIARKEKYTIGKLYVNGTYVCDTLEDRDRFFRGEGKVAGETAIPCGRYEVSQNYYSPRFGSKSPYKEVCNGYVPRLMEVPFFAGVLIHAGNSHRDTEGCVLLGQNKEVGKVLNSKVTWTRLMKDYLLPAKKRNEKVYITIE